MPDEIKPRITLTILLIVNLLPVLGVFLFDLRAHKQEHDGDKKQLKTGSSS